MNVTVDIKGVSAVVHTTAGDVKLEAISRATLDGLRLTFEFPFIARKDARASSVTLRMGNETVTLPCDAAWSIGDTVTIVQPVGFSQLQAAP